MNQNNGIFLYSQKFKSHILTIIQYVCVLVCIIFTSLPIPKALSGVFLRKSAVVINLSQNCNNFPGSRSVSKLFFNYSVTITDFLA